MDKEIGEIALKEILGVNKGCKWGVVMVTVACNLTDTWVTWVEEVVIISNGNKMPFITRIRDGVRVDTIKCHNGKTSITSISHLSNSMEDAVNVMALDQLIEEECLFHAEIAIGREVFVPNVLVEELTILMEGLAGNAKEVTGKEEEDTEVLAVAVAVMTTMVEDMEVLEVMVVMVDHNSSMEDQVMEVLEDMVDHNFSKVDQVMEVQEVKVASEMVLKVTGELIYILK